MKEDAITWRTEREEFVRWTNLARGQLAGRQPRDGQGEKSAEVIVATGNEPRIETVKDSQRSEGLNPEPSSGQAIELRPNSGRNTDFPV